MYGIDVHIQQSISLCLIPLCITGTKALSELGRQILKRRGRREKEEKLFVLQGAPFKGLCTVRFNYISYLS